MADGALARTQNELLQTISLQFHSSTKQLTFNSLKLHYITLPSVNSKSVKITVELYDTGYFFGIYFYLRVLKKISQDLNNQKSIYDSHIDKIDRNFMDTKLN